jgi:hypothetical protein
LWTDAGSGIEAAVELALGSYEDEREFRSGPTTVDRRPGTA